MGDVLAPLIPVAAIIAFTVIRLAKYRAQARVAGGDPHAANRLDAVEQEVDALRQDLSEAQERLDFAERMLAQRKPEPLGPAGGS
ncbi:MAG: hypothetical protein H0W15_08820 [Gemmatimonadales bacterium]|nr:hypothetical protein [Gemmatimonadales bacterium]